jgi:hypothetical protein
MNTASDVRQWGNACHVVSILEEALDLVHEVMGFRLGCERGEPFNISKMLRWRYTMCEKSLDVAWLE